MLNLHVTNSTGASDSTTTVHAFTGYTQSYLSDVPPNGDAGADQYVVPGNQANLDGSASADPDGGPLPLTESWWLNASPPASAAALNNANTATPNFTPDVSGYYIARVEASDGFASGFSNTLVIAAQKCDADANGVINQIDLNLIAAALGQTALANDPRDPLGAGTITSADVAYCSGIVNPVLPNAASMPPSLMFNGAVGTTPGAQNVTVTSNGAAFDFTISTDQSWLMATPSSGNTASNSISVSVTTTGLTAQTYQGNVIVTSAGAGNSPFKIPVTLTLESTSIAATAGTPQVADVNNPFAIAFQALVKDTDGSPVAGATVTFSAPTTGATGTFPGNQTTVQVPTNGSGIATAPVFTADATAGNYNVQATVDGASSPAMFAVTNAVPGPTSLGGLMSSKTGPQNARVWTFAVGNNGPGSAIGAEITSLTLVQTLGAACAPVIVTPMPVQAGNIAPKGLGRASSHDQLYRLRCQRRVQGNGQGVSQQRRGDGDHCPRKSISVVRQEES